MRAAADPLQLDLAVAGLQQRVGRLARSGIVAQQALEGRERRRIVAAHVVRLAEPVQRVRRELVLRIARDEIPQRRRRLVVLAVLQQVEGGLVLGFRAAGRRRGLRGRERGLGGAQARVEVDVLVALLGARAFELVLQLVDLAAQRAQLAGQELDLPRHLEQALVRQLALDAPPCATRAASSRSPFDCATADADASGREHASCRAGIAASGPQRP